METRLETKEQLEKRKALFQYEMTQVILNLKGKFKKLENKDSPIKKCKLTDRDLKPAADFVPLPQEALQAAPLVYAVPESIKQANAYQPLAVLPLNAESKISCPELPDLSAVFQPLGNLKFEHSVQAVTKPCTAIQYTALAAPAVERQKRQIPAADVAAPYAALQAAALKKPELSVPGVPAAAAYVPMSGSKVTAAPLQVPKTGLTNAYVPLADQGLIGCPDAVPPLPQAIAFAPLAPQPVAKVDRAVPELSVLPAVTVAKTSATLAPLPVSVPETTAACVFKPFTQPELKVEQQTVPAAVPAISIAAVAVPKQVTVDAAVPNSMPAVSFAALKTPALSLASKPCPPLKDTKPYVPLKKKSAIQTAPAVAIPAVSLLVAPGSGKPALTELNCRFSEQPLEQTDFQAIWAAL